MKNFGEILSIQNTKATIRIYKQKGDELHPTALTLIAHLPEGYNAGDMVEVDINMFRFLISSSFGYILPFLTTFAAFLISRIFTDSIVIIEAFILLTIVATYLCATHFTGMKFFRNRIICRITGLIEFD